MSSRALPSKDPLAKTVWASLSARSNAPYLSEITAARPVQAASTSAATFATGAALPMFTVAIVPERMIAVSVTLASLLFLALLGAIARRRAALA